MVDTYVVNLSEAVEEVAAMFKSRIIPISAGTPQELAYAERAVRTIGDRSRAMLLGAPHLPNSMWGLSDLQSRYIQDVLPQSNRGNKSPYELRLGRKPNIDHLFIKVFGCPCQFAPMDGPEHKRASKTEWGYYVGMQWPMCLVYQPDNHKILSVSRKKIVCHEGAYANFDPTHTNIPDAVIAEIVPTPDPPDEEPKVNNLQQEDSRIEGVHSIKVLREAKMNSSLNEPLPSPPTKKVTFKPHQPENQGEKPYELEPYLNEDSLMMRINENKEQSSSIRSTHQQIGAALNNIVNQQQGLKTEEYGADISARNVLNERRNVKSLKRKAELQVGDEVKIKTIRFGTQYARGLPEYTYGKIITTKGTKARVLYEGDSHIYNTNKAHLEKVDKDRDPDVAAMVLYEGEWYKRKTSLMTVMAALEVGSVLKKSGESEEASWPKDFFEALVRNDWRDWVEAVQKENEGWRTFDACSEVKYVDMERGASIIPLGELYTIKRSGQHKFRQYAMGNLLKAGKDYGDTFSSTVSGDGLRWFCALAAACNKRIRGWDATTGYLQTK
jgi:hypothetical protein